MKINIIPNYDRKTVTVILGGVVFYSAKYLLERFDEKRYFGNGILKIDKEELGEILKKISASLTLVNPDVRITPKLLYESDYNEYPVFKRHFNQDSEWDGTYEISLGAQSEKRERDLFFEDLARTKPVKNEDVIRSYEWGVEVEFSTKIDEKTLDTKIYVILHRIIRGKKAETKYQTNDDAWGGFDLNEEEEKDGQVTITDKDFPF